jgi:large repetitive protein
MGSPRLRPTLTALALATAVLVPLGAGAPAQAAPCIEVVPGLPICPPPEATTPPAITGDAKVGRVLTAQPPAWDQEGVETTYQWLRDGAAIDGASMPTYTLTGADLGQPVSVRATGRGAGLLPGTADSTTVVPVKGDPITATRPPLVTGTQRVGGTLTTTPGQWGEPEPTYTYQWYRSRAGGSQPIAGATAATYSPVAADHGRTLAVLVTAERVGFEKGVAVSNAVRVPRADSTTVLALPRARVPASETPRVRVTLRGSDGVAPTGVVTVYDGARRVRSVRYGATSSATIVLPRLSVGTHRLSARYAGDATHDASTSDVRVLTVVRPRRRG